MSKNEDSVFAVIIYKTQDSLFKKRIKFCLINFFNATHFVCIF